MTRDKNYNEQQDVAGSAQWNLQLEWFGWQGYQMLSQWRPYLPQSKSILRCMDVVEKYQEFVVVESDLQ